MAVDFNEISSDFKKDLWTIEANKSSMLDCASKAIILARNILYNFKKEIQANGFVSTSDEIRFFNTTKQIPLIPLIYYSEVRSFELQFPKANLDSQKRYVKRKLSKLNRFFIQNMDFAQYVHNKHTHFDEQYYTRNFLDCYHIISSKFYFQDPDFTTARDMLLGKVNAYQKLIEYLKNRLDHEKHKSPLNGHSKNLQWTASKTALTELIYALYYNRVINNGNTDIKEIAMTLQKALHFELGDFYKTFSEIKSRKISRTKFLDDLSSGLITHMDKSEN